MSAALAARRELARRELERRECERHPAGLLDHVKCFDERSAEDFEFHLNDPDSGWYWQRDVLDWWLETPSTIALKARQLGVTWLACGYVLWTALFKPGSLCLMYRQKEEEAFENVKRVWQMLHSLPKHLWNGAEIVTPSKGAQAKSELALKFPNGKVSRILAMTSASASGHGKTAAVVVLDEFSRIDRASEIMKAASPAVGSKGRLIIISTANGVADDEGNGNYFAFLYWHAAAQGFERRFLPWSLHPDRDQDWYDNHPEVRRLRSHEKAEQYPATEHEAFTLTNRVYFDTEALDWYGREAVCKPLYRFDFKKTTQDKARILKSPEGRIAVFKNPDPIWRCAVCDYESKAERSCPNEDSSGAPHGKLGRNAYAIGADVATGRGRDLSAAYVIDLSNMELCAEFHGKVDADLFAFQLHYLGRWYNSALIAVEMGGGWGEPIIVSLRDGKEGRPPYPRLYRHREFDNTQMDMRKTYGFPMNQKTRPLVISQMERALRERSLPWLTSDLLYECKTFVEHETNPSPRAQDGTNDDLVMACAITLEMFRQHGEHPRRYRSKRPKSQYKHWLKLGNP